MTGGPGPEFRNHCAELSMSINESPLSIIENPHANRFTETKKRLFELRTKEAHIRESLQRFFCDRQPEMVRRRQSLEGFLEWMNERTKDAKIEMDSVYKTFNDSKKNKEDITTFANELSWSSSRFYCSSFCIKINDKLILDVDKLMATEKCWRESFDWDAAEQELEAIRPEIQRVTSELREVAPAYAKVEVILEPIRREHSETTRELLGIDQRVAQAQPFEDRLRQAKDPREKAIIHSECESAIGDGKPGLLIEKEKKKRDSLLRNWKKVLDRTISDVRKADRSVKELIIDGSNLCYRDRDFIGLAALIPLIGALPSDCETTVLFDSGICGSLKMTEAEIQKCLPRVVVHVIESSPQADELILESACGKPGAFVLSNDRFVDFKEKEVVVSGRVFRHDILGDLVSVSALGITVRWKKPEILRSGN